MKIGIKAIYLILAGLALGVALIWYGINAEIPERFVKTARILPFGRVWNNKVNIYRMYPPRDSLIIMFGNSITEGVDWTELLQRIDAVNRGIGGDDVYRMNARFEELCCHKPKLICVMAGINDILLGNRTPDQIMPDYANMLMKAKKRNVRLLVFSTLYLYRQRSVNATVADLNSRLKAWCKANNVDYMDVNAVLSNSSGLMLKNTSDGLHLNGEGYKTWGEQLNKWLKVNNI